MGDRNNKTFHNSIRTRQAQNSIREIRCPDGSTAKQHAELKVEAERFFSEVLNHVPAGFQGATVEELKELLEYDCSLEDCRLLDTDVTAEEIRKVVFSMPSNKSPGPDGFPCEFYKAAWSVIAPDFITAVQSVFQLRFLRRE